MARDWHQVMSTFYPRLDVSPVPLLTKYPLLAPLFGGIMVLLLQGKRALR